MTSPCDGELLAAPGSATVRCRVCGTVRGTEARRAWLLGEVDEVLAHAELIARAVTALGVTVTGSQIRNWPARGRLAAKGVDHAARPPSRIGDVIPLPPRQSRAADTIVYGDLAAVPARRSKEATRLLHEPNDAMLDRAAVVVAIWVPELPRGGTWSAVRKAHQRGLPVVHVNPAARTVTTPRADRLRMLLELAPASVYVR